MVNTMEMPALGKTIKWKAKKDTSELNLHWVLDCACSNGKQSDIETAKVNSSAEQEQYLHF